MNELAEMINSRLNNKWTSFTYIFRKPLYRIRLFKRFLKYEYYGPWEIGEPLLEIIFETFCEFYENSGIFNNVDFQGSGSHWVHAEKEMHYLYKWWTEIRQERQREINTLLHEWSDHFVSWIEAQDDGFGLWCSIETKYCKHLSDMLHEEEMKFDKETEDALIRLIKIRNYLWS